MSEDGSGLREMLATEGAESGHGAAGADTAEAVSPTSVGIETGFETESLLGLRQTG